MTSVSGAAVRLAGSLAATLTAYSIYRLLRLVYSELTSPLRALPGPESKSWLYGNFKEIWGAENSVIHEKWIAEHGKTIKYKAFLGMTRLFTMDTKAISHILTNSYTYQKPGPARYQLSRILGNGVLVVEEDKHKHQRRIMNPAFGPAQIRELTEIFVEKSNELRDIWMEQIKETGKNRIEVLSWLTKMTLDVIGLAGFNYNFNTLNPNGEPNELSKAFEGLFQTQNSLPILPILAGFFPPLRILPMDREKEVQQSKATMNRIGHQLIRESKASIYDKSRGRDLLTLLVRANMATDVPENQRLSDDDVLAQVPTFLVAGHETTSNAVTWAIFALTQDIAVQSKLREELLSVDTETPTMDQLNALPYLDMVVRETLRLHAPVPSTLRVAVKDDVLPLGEPFMDRNGKMQYELQVKKGQTLFIPILAVHRSKELWGEDAREFKPERWAAIPDGATTIPGVWSNLLTFLGGPRACIGYRFSLIEIKALLFSLVRAFEFELAVPVEDIQKKSSVVQRPVLRSDPEGGNQLPVLIKPYSGA